MGDEKEMIHSVTDIYNAILSTVNTITGQTYVLDRAPQKNFSDGFSGCYRYLRPTTIQKERRSQGAPETIVTMEVGILSLDATESSIEAVEDELDLLLNSLLRIGQIEQNVLVYAADCTPTAAQYLAEEGLNAEIQVVAARANISVRGYY